MLCLRSLLTAVLAVCLWSSVVSAFAGKKKTRGKQNRVNFSQLGYTLSAITMTDTGFDGTLSLVEPYNLYGDDITPLQLKVLFESDVSTNYPISPLPFLHFVTKNCLRVKIFDPKQARWEVPGVVVDRQAQRPQSRDYVFLYSPPNQPFGFAVQRASTGDIIFNTSSCMRPVFPTIRHCKIY